MKVFPAIYRTPLLLAALALLGSCAQIGPRALSDARPLYNIAVQQTDAQQLLLNVVRQRYSDPVLFLEVTSISTGYSRSANAGLSGKLFEAVTDSAGGSLGGSVKESPNIFYSPNKGEKFVRQMLKPLDVQTVALILQAGWSIERVMMLTGESMNSLRNSPTNRDAKDRHYHEALVALRHLQRSGALMVGADPANGGQLALVIAPDKIDSNEFRTACGLLAIACDGRPIRLKEAFGAAGDGETLAIATRSLFSTLYFLAQTVDVPAKDTAAGVASPGPSNGSGAGDWNDTLFRIRSSAEEPDRAAVKIRYRDSWFYIADDDIDSKVTFALLSMLLTLQSGDTSKMSPLLTLPAQ